MIWIVSKAASGTETEMEARHHYIEEVTGADVSEWTEYIAGSPEVLPEYYAKSNDGLPYVFITAHTNEVKDIISRLPKIVGIKNYKYIKKIIINSCITCALWIKEIKSSLYLIDLNVVIYYSKQDVYKPNNKTPLLVNYPKNVGTYGFLTTKSERGFFRHRNEGIDIALRKTFMRI